MGSCRKATRPARVKPTVRSVVPTGRLMNGSLMLTARSPRVDRLAARSGPAVAAAAAPVFRSAAARPRPERLAAFRRTRPGRGPAAVPAGPAPAGAAPARVAPWATAPHADPPSL